MRETWSHSAILALALAFAPMSANANSGGDFSGGVAIGSGYAVTDTAPTNGLLVQGNVAIGTTSPVSGTAFTVNGAADASSLLLNSAQVPLTPGGRLTLSSNTPVMTADVTAATTIYYADYSNDLVPVYNGTNWIEYALSGQISLALDSNSAHTGYQQSGKLFDLVVMNNAGTPELCTGPAWSSNTARASSIALINGIWTNSGSWTVKCDATSSTYTCSANQCTYVGTMYATANGQTGIQCNATAVAGGPTGGGYVYVYNAYNRIPLTCAEQDITQWTYATGAYRQADGSTGNQINFIDGLQQTPINAIYSNSLGNSTAGNFCWMTLNLDTTTAAGKSQQYTDSATNVLGENIMQLTVPYFDYPHLGYHYVAAIEYASATCTYNGNGSHLPANMSLTLHWQF